MYKLTRLSPHGYLSLTAMILAAMLLSACTQPAEDPKKVADRYWQQLQTGNTEQAEKLVTINSRHDFGKHRDYINKRTQVTNNKSKTIVPTSVTKVDETNNQRYTEVIETVLVLEQGKWKIDASLTQLPTHTSKQEELQKLAEDLSESMHDNIDSIDQAMDQGMQMLDEALEEGSKEMSQSLLHLMNELNSSMQESIIKMKQRRQQQLEQEQENQQKAPKPDPQRGEGMI